VIEMNVDRGKIILAICVLIGVGLSIGLTGHAYSRHTQCLTVDEIEDAISSKPRTIHDLEEEIGKDKADIWRIAPREPDASEWLNCLSSSDRAGLRWAVVEQKYEGHLLRIGCIKSRMRCMLGLSSALLTYTFVVDDDGTIICWLPPDGISGG